MNLPFPFESNLPLAQFSYMKVGGPADYLSIAHTSQDLKLMVTEARKINLPYFILGAGSNTIFSDSGFRGLIIINRSNRLNIDLSTHLVTCDSGVPTNLLVNQTVAAGLAGLEPFLGLPGTIGGAIYNNSHYKKSLIGDSLNRVELLDSDNQSHWVKASDLKFAYDYSILQDSHELILQAEFALIPKDADELKQAAADTLFKRKHSQPLELPSSGCMFKNLPTGESVGALIDQLGLKGKSVGGAEISSVHANFIVNTGSASTQNIIDLSNQVIDLVKAKHNIILEREVFIVNEFGERIES